MISSMKKRLKDSMLYTFEINNAQVRMELLACRGYLHVRNRKKESHSCRKLGYRFGFEKDPSLHAQSNFFVGLMENCTDLSNQWNNFKKQGKFDRSVANSRVICLYFCFLVCFIHSYSFLMLNRDRRRDVYDFLVKHNICEAANVKIHGA